jgi:hypothetical protein
MSVKPRSVLLIGGRPGRGLGEPGPGAPHPCAAVGSLAAHADASSPCLRPPLSLCRRSPLAPPYPATGVAAAHHVGLPSASRRASLPCAKCLWPRVISAPPLSLHRRSPFTPPYPATGVAAAHHVGLPSASCRASLPCASRRATSLPVPNACGLALSPHRGGGSPERRWGSKEEGGGGGARAGLWQRREQ